LFAEIIRINAFRDETESILVLDRLIVLSMYQKFPVQDWFPSALLAKVREYLA
jgi:hypothetical protein